MGLVRDHAGCHQSLAEMHGTMIAAISDRFTNRQGLRSLRRCLDRSQTDVEERPQASKAPVRYPRRRQWMRLGHFSPIVAESRVPLAFGAWRGYTCISFDAKGQCLDQNDQFYRRPWRGLQKPK